MQGSAGSDFVFNPWKRTDSVEKMHARTAEIVASPSLDLMHYARQRWGIAASKIRHVPYPYTPTPEYLAIPCDTHTDRIAFVGRLEMRKGILDLASAIPLVLRCYPDVTFRFIGKDRWMPGVRRGAIEVIKEVLGPAEKSVQFMGPVPLDAISRHLGEVDICVFPSIWDNFPNACLEAMAAGRGIVASNAGGMAEMLSGGAGLLVPPKSPQAIAEALTSLLLDPSRRIALGRQARCRLLENYNKDRIGYLTEEAFKDAVCARFGAIGVAPFT